MLLEIKSVNEIYLATLGQRNKSATAPDIEYQVRLPRSRLTLRPIGDPEAIVIAVLSHENLEGNRVVANDHHKENTPIEAARTDRIVMIATLHHLLVPFHCLISIQSDQDMRDKKVREDQGENLQIITPWKLW